MLAGLGPLLPPGAGKLATERPWLLSLGSSFFWGALRYEPRDYVGFCGAHLGLLDSDRIGRREVGVRMMHSSFGALHMKGLARADKTLAYALL